MNTVCIKKLTLSNWRGQNNEVRFSHRTIIKGRNEEGKSTIFNAWLWLLTGADELDRVNYQLFDNTIEQTYENAKPASVEAVLDVDGYEYTFKKVVKQGWQRVRGSSEYTRKGTDDYSFFTDGIEVPATQYKQQIESLFAPIDKLKIILNLRHFLMLDWKEMRKQLETMVGEIESSDFKGDYGVILQDLVKHTPDELKSLYKAQIKSLKTSIDGLPKSIETMQDNLPDLAEVDEARKTIDEAKRQIESIDFKIAGTEDFAKPYIEKRKAEIVEISKLQEEYSKAQYVYLSNFNNEVEKIQKEIREVDDYNHNIDIANKKERYYKEYIRQELANLNDLLVGLQKKHKELTEQNMECKARIFTGGLCAYCKQELPDDKLEEARARFNEQKEKEHEYIVAQGKANRKNIDGLLNRMEKLEAELANPLKMREKKDKSDLEAKLADLRESFVQYDQTPEGGAKLSVIEEKQATMTVIPQHNNDELLSTKFALLDEIEANSKKLGLKDEYDKQIEKIKGLQCELKNNSIEIAKMEGKLAKVKEYEEEKAKIISDKVNRKFEYVRIEMSETNKSGEVVPTCIIRDHKGVNALVTNNASRILCGLDISLAFQRFYSLQMPIFVDNAESINDDKLPDIDGQTIIMKVDDCKLTIL